MKHLFIKQAGGVLVPASDEEAEKLLRYKTGEICEAEIKLWRNPQFHRKVFAFFGFCFEHWSGDQAGLENMDEASQFDRFRKDLTILAGYFEQTVRLNGEFRTEAKSLAYGNMEQDEFEKVYNALIKAALKHIFGKTTDQNTINRLYAFF